MQLFGLAATVLVLPVAVWGWRIATHRAVRPRVDAAARSGSSARCSPPASRPACRAPRAGRCRPGLGGVIGDAMLRAAGARARARRPASSCWLGRRDLRRLHVRRCRDRRAASAIATRRRARRALGARGRSGPDDDDDEERTSISLGWLVHDAAEPQGAHRPADDAPLGAARAQQPRRAPMPSACRSATGSSRAVDEADGRRRRRRGRRGGRRRGRAARAQARAASRSARSGGYPAAAARSLLGACRNRPTKFAPSPN